MLSVVVTSLNYLIKIILEAIVFIIAVFSLAVTVSLIIAHQTIPTIIIIFSSIVTVFMLLSTITTSLDKKIIREIECLHKKEKKEKMVK